MANKNSQILLIENVLSNLNDHINEKEQEVKEFENETSKLKTTISTLKFECKNAFDEQEKLEETVSELRKQNHLLSEQLKTKEQKLNVKEKEFEAFKLENEKFVDNIENKIEGLKKQLDEKNTIITELESMNRSLNDKLQNTTKNGNNAISRLQRKLEQEEIKNFVNSNNSYDIPKTKYDKLEAAINSQKNPKPEKTENTNSGLKLDKLEDKLKPAKKTEKIINNAHIQTEEDILKRNLGFSR
jgi:chromosome segregation ATPase